MRCLALMACALLTVACTDANGGKEVVPGPSPEVTSCDPMVRVQREVSVMFRNEWMSGSLALAVCRGTPAERADLSPLMTWLADEARAGRMRTCRAGEGRVSPEVMATADKHAAGIRDWCFVVLADI